MAEFQVLVQRQPGVTARVRVTAADAAQVAAALGVAPRQLVAVREVAPRAPTRAATRGRLSVRFFSQELAVLLDAGIPLAEALATLEQKEFNPAVARSLGDLRAALVDGQSLSAALVAQPAVFDELFVSVVRANERSGSLAAALRAHARHRAWAEGLQSKLVSALIYPALLLLVGSAVMLFLLVFVLPRFEGVFGGGTASLPWASQWLYSLGGVGARHPAVAVGLWAALPLLALAAWRHPAAQAHLTVLAWRLPVLGPRLRVLALAGTYRTLGMLLQSGVPVLAALRLVQGAAPAALRPGFGAAAQAVSEGRRLSDALDGQGLATPVAQRMLRVGESSGELAQMLERAAAFHDEELERLSDWIRQALNPLLMAGIGVVIGAVVVLMYLPIFDLIDQIQ